LKIYPQSVEPGEALDLDVVHAGGGVLVVRGGGSLALDVVLEVHGRVRGRSVLEVVAGHAALVVGLLGRRVAARAVVAAVAVRQQVLGPRVGRAQTYCRYHLAHPHASATKPKRNCQAPETARLCFIFVIFNTGKAMRRNRRSPTLQYGDSICPKRLSLTLPQELRWFRAFKGVYFLSWNCNAIKSTFYLFYLHHNSIFKPP